MKKFDADTKVVPLILPRDGAGGSMTGDWVSLAVYDSATVIYATDVGTDTQDVTVKLRQAKTAAGGNAKDLNAGTWYVAQNATVANLGDTLTADTGSTDPAGEFVDDGESACIARIEVTADQLDTDNDFAFVTVSVSDSGATAGKLQSVVAVLRGARYSVAVEDQPTVLS